MMNEIENTGNVTVLLSNGAVIEFNIYECEHMPFVWGAYSQKTLEKVCGVYLAHDLPEAIYTKPF